MSRTKGARDRFPRRGRSDAGKRRKKYAGKKVKTKRQIIRDRRKGNKTHIKLRWLEKRKMSIEGWRNWNPKVRLKIRPFVYKFGIVTLTPVADISTKKDFQDWAVQVIGFPGEFIIMGISRTFKNRFQRKWVKMCTIVINQHQEGLRARMVQNTRLFRYKWFYKD